MEVASASEASSFGKYTLVAKLATGGMAEIFLARLLSDGGFEKLVCIKRILPHLAKDPQFVAMFLDEARVVARISHPNVCQVFELGEIAGQYYIAMEYLAGVPLAAFRRKDYYAAPPDPRMVAGFGVQACEGLHHAHQLKRPDGSLLGVVHRDISPQNLFLTVDGIVKVLDFGIAKVHDQSVRTSTGAVKGTYAYMSPEQLRGEKVDRRADVWALGAVIWETLAQRHLFKRETEFLTFQAITADPIPDICELRPEVPPLIGDALSRALSRDREDRFATARALGEALAQAVGPLGGPLGAAALSDVVAHAFESTLSQQRHLIEMAREGDTFDLEQSNPLGPRSGTTPVSNIAGKVAAAKAEVAQYVAMQQALAEMDDAETSASGFTPPPQRASQPYPVQRKSEPHAIQRKSQPYAAQRKSQPYATEPGDGVPVAAHYTHTMPVVVPSSRLPWVIALVAVAIAAGAAAMLYMNMQTKAPETIAMHAEAPPPAVVIAPAIVAPDAALVAPPIVIDAAVATVPDAAPQVVAVKPITHPDNHPPRQPAISGPPGFITIDSAPVYAVVYVDGNKLGETPLVHISLAPGKHVVRAVSPSGSTRTLSITIESGKTAPVRRIEW